MIQALFGLIGVVVGGLITAGTAWANARSERRRDTKAAARLVRNELMDGGAALMYAREQGGWWNDGDLITRCWTDQRAVLTEVPRATWDSVAGAYASLETFERTRKSQQGMRPLEADLTDAIARVETAAGALDDAYLFGTRWWRRDPPQATARD